MKSKKYFTFLGLIVIVLLVRANEKSKDEIINEVICPNCGFKFKAITVVRPDGRGGEDTDFLVRSLNVNPYSFMIWTCPRCYFSAGSEDFNKKLDPKGKGIIYEKADIKKELNLISQKDIPDWLKYENAIKYYKKTGKDNQFIAGLYLKASWVIRLDTFQYTPEMEEISQKIWKETKKEPNIPFFGYYQSMAMSIEEKIKNKSVKEKEVQLWRLVQSDYIRKSGNHLASYEILKLLKKDPIYKKYASQIDKGIFFCQKEKEYQLQAYKLFSEDFKNNKIAKEKRGVIAYLIGELARRLGDKKEALTWFQTSLEIIPKDFPLYPLIDYQIKVLKK